MERCKETFKAQADDGKFYVIGAWVKLIDARHQGAKNAPPIEGSLIAYRTQNGDPVNQNEDGSFTVVSTGVVVRRLPVKKP